MVADPTFPMYLQEAVSQSLDALIKGKVPDAVTVSSNYFGGAGTLYEKETVAIIECILDHDFTPDPTFGWINACLGGGRRATRHAFIYPEVGPGVGSQGGSSGGIVGLEINSGWGRDPRW